MQAAIAGTKDVSLPVIFSIVTTIIAFVPLLFMPGETGKFWQPLPAVVIVILAVSLLEALFILPSHLGHLKDKKSKIKQAMDAGKEKFQEEMGKIKSKKA